jgi:hypothetical protein
MNKMMKMPRGLNACLTEDLRAPDTKANEESLCLEPIKSKRDRFIKKRSVQK